MGSALLLYDLAWEGFDSRQSTWRSVAALATLSLAAGLLLASNLAAGPSSVAAAGQGRRPNIVLVLTDDLSNNLVRYMPHVRALKAAGMTFTNYTVTDSLCCPSRSSIFTGRYPHNTGVFANEGPDGGFGAFQLHGDDRLTFALALHRAGYRTAMMGKYLNGYSPMSDSGYAGPGQIGWPGTPARDGASFLGLAHGRSAAHWRTIALVEHHGMDFTQYQDDPDWEPGSERDIPSYNALRSAQFTYVRYENGEREY